jgi:xylulokinase
MLPGDYIAMKLTGEIQTTVSGLSEGIMWDFKKHPGRFAFRKLWFFF